MRLKATLTHLIIGRALRPKPAARMQARIATGLGVGPRPNCRISQMLFVTSAARQPCAEGQQSFASSRKNVSLSRLVNGASVASEMPITTGSASWMRARPFSVERSM